MTWRGRLGLLLVTTFAITIVAGSSAAKGPKAAKATAPAPPPAQRGLVYVVDNAHSFMEFSVRLLGFNRVRGLPLASEEIYEAIIQLGSQK